MLIKKYIDYLLLKHINYCVTVLTTVAQITCLQTYCKDRSLRLKRKHNLILSMVPSASHLVIIGFFHNFYVGVDLVNLVVVTGLVGVVHQLVKDKHQIIIIVLVNI